MCDDMIDMAIPKLFLAIKAELRFPKVGVPYIVRDAFQNAAVAWLAIPGCDDPDDGDHGSADEGDHRAGDDEHRSRDFHHSWYGQGPTGFENVARCTQYSLRILLVTTKASGPTMKSPRPAPIQRPGPISNLIQANAMTPTAMPPMAEKVEISVWLFAGTPK
jgi:hypothetical protein